MHLKSDSKVKIELAELGQVFSTVSERHRVPQIPVVWCEPGVRKYLSSMQEFSQVTVPSDESMLM